MNKDTAHLYLPHVEALRDGELQERALDGWIDISEATFSRQPDRYRRKPKPREWFVNEYDGERFGTLRPSKEQAEDKFLPHRIRTIRVREVLE